jgi:hypothetical protein
VMRTPREVSKNFSRNASRCFTNIAKVCHCPRELLWRKHCVNRCKAAYFFVINQFWELFEVICMSTGPQTACHFVLKNSMVWVRERTIPTECLFVLGCLLLRNWFMVQRRVKFWVYLIWNFNFKPDSSQMYLVVLLCTP